MPLRSPARLVIPVLSLLFATPARAADPLVITTSGQIRMRYEYRDPTSYASFPRSTDVALLRTRLGLAARVSPGVRVFAQIQDSRTMGSEPSPTADTRNVDLHQAFADLDSLGCPGLALRVGRFEMSYGDQRVVGVADWGNVGRSFDGARLRWTRGALITDAVASWIAERGNSGQDRFFLGAHSGWKHESGEVEGYLWMRDFNGTYSVPLSATYAPQIEDRTFGLRVRHASGPWELRGEAMHQTGERQWQLVRANAADVRVSCEVERRRHVRLAVEATHASGDTQDPATWRRFDPLFSTSHAVLGYADQVAFSNVRAVQLSLTSQWTPALGFQLDAHRFWRTESEDGWFDASGALLRSAPTGAGAPPDALGSELDLTVRWKPRTGVSILGGASAFLVGDYVRATGGGASMGWGFVQMQVDF